MEAPELRGGRTELTPINETTLTPSRDFGSMKALSPRFDPIRRYETLRKCIERRGITHAVMLQPVLSEFSGGDDSPRPTIETDAEFLDSVAREAEVALHPATRTCLPTA